MNMEYVYKMVKITLVIIFPLIL